MNKVIIKSALVTLASLAVAALSVFSLWILCSPQTMADVCEKTGNYSFAVTCAGLRYKYTDDIGDLARCVEDAILSGKDKQVIEYGEKLIGETSFNSLCNEKDKKFAQGNYGEITLDYKTYICGRLSAAEYRAGDLQTAVNTAKLCGAQGFRKLILEILDNNDKQSAQVVLSEINGISGDDEEMQGLIALLENLK